MEIIRDGFKLLAMVITGHIPDKVGQLFVAIPFFCCLGAFGKNKGPSFVTYHE